MTGSIESLYPFLYSGTTDVSAVFDQVRQSTVAKAAEILRLRRAGLDADGVRLLTCAREMADRFAAGGRLLAFGNGGSATDAQQLATLFLHPGGTARPLAAPSLASDASVLTALSNDIGVDVVFARQVAAFGSKGDIAVGLSTSGDSENLLRRKPRPRCTTSSGSYVKARRVAAPSRVIERRIRPHDQHR